MEKVAPDIAYRRLKYVSDWRLVEENQRAALAAIVHGISRLDAAGHWGDGPTSASDGQRFAMPQKVLRTYSTRFNDFALEFYSFVADSYAPFYSRPIECTDRDAPFVLDGVLYHESDLDLEEHYTDTHGYTEINFAAFGMVGMRFCPRIRSLHRQRIYCADPARDHGVLEPVLKRGRRAVNLRLIAEQWDRIGQFYAAFPAGQATASAALQRLNRFQASNQLLRRQPGARPSAEDRVRAAVHVRAATAGEGAAGPAQGRAAPRPGAGHLLWAAGSHQRPRGRRPGERVLVPDADPRLHRLLAGPGDLADGRRAGLPVRPRPAASRQPDSSGRNVVLYGEIKIDPAKLKRRSPSSEADDVPEPHFTAPGARRLSRRAGCLPERGGEDAVGAAGTRAHPFARALGRHAPIVTRFRPEPVLVASRAAGRLPPPRGCAAASLATS